MKTSKKQDKAQATPATPATATGTKTDVVAVSSAKVITTLVELTKAEGKVANAFNLSVRVIRSEVARLGYDRKQASQMVSLSMRAAKGFASTDADAIATFDKANRPSVSKLIGVAFPEKENEAGVNAAIAHDEKMGDAKHGRIGTNKILEISRGNLTFADALAGKPAQRKATTATAVIDYSATALENALAGIRSKFATAKDGQIAHFTPAQLRAMSDKVFCDGAYSPAKAS